LGAGAKPAEPAAIQTPAAEPEERRWVTVLFADLSGFTSLCERLDPEDVTALIDGCMARLGSIVERYGGVVEQIIGDQLMAVFGAPLAHEDDPERAVRVALDLQRCAAEHADDFRGLPLRIGVNTGEVMFAPVGPGGARRPTVMGDTTNTASRLQTAAPPGGTLVGEETYRATSRAVRYEAVAPFQAKGKEAAVAAWRPLEALGTSFVRPLSEVPLIGREAELDGLRRTWAGVVADRRPHLATVIGPPGIGKTRLARELTAAVEAAGGRCIAGRSLPYGELTGYGAFAQQIKGLAGILETDPVPLAREKLAGVGAAPLGDEAGTVTSQVATLIGLGGDEVPEKAPLLYSARRFVEAVAADAPTLFLFEDVHWADASLLDLIEMLAGRVRDAPVLLLALARPELLETRPRWGGGLPSSSTLGLAPLAGAQAASLASHLAPHATPEIANRLVEVAGGNPLFLEELTASLSDATKEFLGRLPSTVSVTIAARLDALPAALRQVILDASVVGKIFWRGALERLGPDRPVRDLLDELERRDFIRRERSSRFGGDEEFCFRHMLIADVAHATLPKAARRERHAAVARFLEDSAGDRRAEFASLLAHHWLEAGDEPRALGYLVEAAEHARRSWATTEAVGLYERALELAGDDGALHRRLELGRAMALWEGSDLARAIPELDRLIPELDGTERAETTWNRGIAAFFSTDIGGVRRFAQQLGELAEQLGDREYHRLELALSAAANLLGGGLAEACTVAQEALADWPDAERRPERSWILGNVGLAHYWMGECGRSLEINDTAWRLAREVQSLQSFLLNAPHVGLALAGLGRHEEAIAHLEWSLGQARDLELVPRFTSRCAGMLAGVLYDAADTERARALSAETIELSAQGGFPTSGIFSRIDLLVTDTKEGDLGHAQTAFDPLWKDAQELRGWHEWLARGRLLQARSDLLLATGAGDEATEAAIEALDYWSGYQRPKYIALGRATLGSAHLACGRPAEALAELRRAEAVARGLGHPPTTYRVLGAVVAALAAAGDDDAAASLSAERRTDMDAFASRLSPERGERFLAAWA